MSKLLPFAIREYGVSEYGGKQMTGDTLFSIGKHYGVTPDYLMKVNSLSGPLILIGQQLRISDRRMPISNPRIVKYAEEAGFFTIKTDQEAWCAIFMKWCALKAGIEVDTNASARSWLNAGKRVNTIDEADAAVFWREDPNSNLGHVAIPLNYTEDRKQIYVLGGNQSNMVCVKPYEAARLIAFIQLPK